MKKFSKEVNHIMREALNSKDNETWTDIFETFFNCLINSNNVGFSKLVADAVTDIVCETLSDEWVLNKAEIDLLYTLYGNYADRFEEQVRRHISRKVYAGDLCEPA